jgi:hypothetical protein
VLHLKPEGREPSDVLDVLIGVKISRCKGKGEDMDKSLNKVLYILTLIIIILSIVVASIGVFYTTNGKAFEVTNQYGDLVKIYGDGIYSHDSYFKAPIFRGSDFTILFLAVPVLILALIKGVTTTDRRGFWLK